MPLDKKTKSTLQTWIDKLWIEWAKKKLQKGGMFNKLQTKAKETAPIKQINTDISKSDVPLVPAKWYKKDQIWMKDINLIPEVKKIDESTPEEKLRIPGVTETKKPLWGTTLGGEVDKWTWLWETILKDENWVLDEQKTELEFKKQKAEQDKLKAQEEERIKLIGEWETSYRTQKWRLETLQDRAEADNKDKFENAIKIAEIEQKNLSNNINMARSGLWMPESKAEGEWFDTIISENQRQFDRLNKLYSTSKDRLSEDFQKQFDDLNTKRKSVFNENMRKLLDEMSLSDLEWGLDTMEWLEWLRTKLQDVLYSDEEMAIANIQKYQFGLDQITSQIDKLEEFEASAKKIDETASKMKGYYINENWDPFTNDSWEFIDIPENSTVVYKSDLDANWKMTIISRWDDDTLSMESFNTWLVWEGTTPKLETIKDEFGNEIPVAYNSETKQWETQKIKWLDVADTKAWAWLKTTFTPDQEAARTNRHNNPTAFTTQIAEQAWLVEWVDYEQGDAFPDNPNMFTAKLMWDGIDKTKKVIDSIGFYTQSWEPRWTYLNDVFEWENADNIWSVLEEDEKSEIIKEMYWYETDNKYENFEWFTLEDEAKDDYTVTQKAIMDKFLEDPAAKDNRQALRRAGLTENDISTYKTVEEWMWSLWVPIAYERQIKQMVPTQLMNSEVELAALNDTIKRMGESWTPVAEAVLTYLWFDTKKIDDKEKATEYVNIGKNLWEDLPTNYFATVSNYLTKWDLKGADKYISNIVEDKVKSRYWEDAIMTASINQTMKDTRNLSNLISKNPEKIGQFDGRVNDFMRKFKDFPEMTELNTLLTMTQAQTRKHFAWSAVTPSEMTALQDFIWGNTKMTPNNLLTMLSTIKDRTESQFLLQRKQFGYTPALKDKEWKIIKETKPLDTAALDEIDSWFFNQSWKWELDKEDEDFFNNL